MLEFKPDWLPNAVPFQNNNPEKCYRYERLPHNDSAISYSQGHNHFNDRNVIAFCEAIFFNRSSRVYCKDDGFIFKSEEISIVNEVCRILFNLWMRLIYDFADSFQFDITCEENQWKLAMVGAMGNFGKIFIMPLIGHFSDRYAVLRINLHSNHSTTPLQIRSSESSHRRTHIELQLVAHKIIRYKLLHVFDARISRWNVCLWNVSHIIHIGSRMG